MFKHEYQTTSIKTPTGILNASAVAVGRLADPNIIIYLGDAFT